MNKKGMDGVGILIGAFVMILVGLVLFAPIANNVADTTDAERETTNQTFTFPSTANTTINLNGRAFVGTPVLYNSTGEIGHNGLNGTGDYATLGNFTFTSNNLLSGALEATVSCVTCDINALGQEMNASYTYVPDNYIADGGARSLAVLIVIFTALAVFVVAVMPVARQGLMNMFGMGR